MLDQVEDDPCDGIVQAEEEEEANSETEIFPSATARRRKQRKLKGMKQNATEKRLLFGEFGTASPWHLLQCVHQW